MDDYLRKRIASGQVLIAPSLDVTKNETDPENPTYQNDSLFCPHCTHFVPRRTEFHHNEHYTCVQCNTVSLFSLWSPTLGGGYKGALTPIN